MKKKVIAELEKCYSVAPLKYQGRQHILVAAEKTDRCILFDAEGNEKATVWEQPGGVMTMVQVPGTDGQFLATHKFYSPNDSKEAKIIIATPDGSGNWEIRTLTDLPFVHRFDILQSGGENYLIACTLKSGHECKDDWSNPGKVYAAKLPEDLSVFDEEHQLELQVLKDGMLKNHGYYKVIENGKETSLVCSENGVFRFWPPETKEDAWEIEQLLDTPASDAAMIDLDGDGKMELLVLSPFHGDEVTIYKKENEKYVKVYQYPEKADFLHAIWSGRLAGKPVAVIGHRKGARRLLAFSWDENKKDYTFKTLDDDCGPANAYGYAYGEKDILISANREINEIAMYIFEKGDL
ncbi:MAG: hypothetical protein KH828_10730 [Clostridiales bacterium]|nr:hypothetical protein [Clostridiales bacterium]